ncbi:hypothetical protein AO398_05035 [Methylobacterium sp. GXS13]|jgi:hypothetical protein|uniref:hypothetical protein n=1 Tax=unclassified Methylobacterium TaxID=2615210 RepID=UPI00071B4453|nr:MULTISPECIES: hypothetical protein [unclassified Methylobacterium]KST59124.1 hypothetical protein AO398_05035 [Methylobacterium sp. GXS13]MCJ2120837.1 hypothetical protein [Methylobacterium sp. J-001]
MSDETETDLDEAEDIRDAEAEAKTRADNRAERAERAERMAREGAQAMAEHHASIKAIDERTLKLRSLRLAKEAAEAETKAAEAQTKAADAQAKAAEKAAKAAAKSAGKGTAKKAAPKKAAAKD